MASLSSPPWASSSPSKHEPASAGSAVALAAAGRCVVEAGAALTGCACYIMSRRTQSYYCYPKNYWWFYRPYTTALDGHARCMPYFHYLGALGRRGAKSDGLIK